MYNRYIPQPDGSFRRNRMPEPHRANPKPPPPRREAAPEPCPEPARQTRQAQAHPGHGNFLRQLLPRDFDTGDLIVVLLLLLMAGDCEEDRNNAILTLALYFIM